MEQAAAVEALTYLPVGGYLAIACVLLWATGRIPAWVHPVVLLFGIGVRVAQSGMEEPAYTVGIALFVFVVLVFVASRTISGATLFTLVGAFALVPFQGLPGILIGLLVAAGVAVWRTLRGIGKERVTWLAMDTMAAMGVSPAGIGKPQPSLIPERDDLTDVRGGSPEADRMRMYLPPYLLLGVGLAATYAYLTF